ncbi:hypothetical protein Tco_0493650 [Tanacetum coccineum]
MLLAGAHRDVEGDGTADMVFHCIQKWTGSDSEGWHINNMWSLSCDPTAYGRPVAHATYMFRAGGINSDSIRAFNHAQAFYTMLKLGTINLVQALNNEVYESVSIVKSNRKWNSKIGRNFGV